MMSCPPSHRTHALIRWLLPAAVLVLAPAWQANAAASSVSSADRFDAEEHAHYCECGTCRGASCCCGPRRSKAKQALPTPAAVPARPADGPCLNSAPCGDPGLPTAPAAGAFAKAASLVACSRFMPDATGQLLPPDARCILPARRSARLDEPPESPSLA